jgi:hypothetical protein
MGRSVHGDATALGKHAVFGKRTMVARYASARKRPDDQKMPAGEAAARGPQGLRRVADIRE